MTSLVVDSATGWLDCSEPSHYVARDFETVIFRGCKRLEVLMAERNEPDELEQRRRKLEDALAARSASSKADEGNAKQNNDSGGFGNAFKLSGEFIGGVVVGVGLGWFFDRLFGTSPWGLIIFLLLGFAAGVLNVLRAAGRVAEFGSQARKDGGADDPQRK
jgi:ATP synthase protein I